MKPTPHDIAILAGIGSLTGGAYVQFGLGWALMALGGQLIAMALASLARA